MNTMELFCGTKSFSKVMAAQGHDTLTIDNDEQFEPDYCMDVLEMDVISYKKIDILWASPPCQGFSVAAIGKNWYPDHTPKTDSARLGIKLVNKTIGIIKALNPTWCFIENPRGKLRKLSMVRDFTRHTVTYCQYGDTRMKPTDIWTNAYWWKPRPACLNGMKCHESAPRGSRSGTQGIKGAKDRGVIPSEIFEEILAQLPNSKIPRPKQLMQKCLI